MLAVNTWTLMLKNAERWRHSVHGLEDSAILITAMWCFWWRGRHTDQQNRIENPETESH